MEHIIHRARQYGRINISELESRDFVALIYNDDVGEVLGHGFSNDPTTALKKAMEMASQNYQTAQELLN